MNDQATIPLPKKDGPRPSVDSPNNRDADELGTFLDAKRDPLEASVRDEAGKCTSPNSLAMLSSLPKALLAADHMRAEIERQQENDARTEARVDRVLEGIASRA